MVSESPLRVTQTLSHFTVEYDGETSSVRTQGDVKAMEEAALAAEAEAKLGTAFVKSKPSQDLATAVLIVQFSDESAPPATVGSFTRLMDKVESYWQDNSGACSSYTLTFSPILTLAGTRASYGGSACPIQSVGATSSQLDDDAWAAWGESEAGYDRYILVFSEFTTCPWAGLGLVAGSASWINGVTDPEFHWHVTAHELGHNYGLKHANLWVTNGRDSPGGDGDSVAYFDDFDIMGAISITADRSSFHVNNHKKFGLGWIPSADVATATAAACSSSPCLYRVSAHDHVSASGTRALRVLQSGNRWYWMGVRQALAYAPAKPFFDNGLVFHYIDDFGDSQVERESNLLDMTAPFTSDSAWTNATDDAPLQLGFSYTDAGASITVTPLTRGQDPAGNDYMEVAVYVGSPNNPPTLASVGIDGCTSVSAGELVMVTASASDLDGDTLSYGWSFGDGTYGSSSSASVAHAWGTSGQFTVQVTVSDMRGGVATSSTSFTVGGSGASSCGCQVSGGCGTAGGQCAFSTCVCPGGATGTNCETELVVTSAVPSPPPASGTLTVTTSLAVFDPSSPSSGLCWFRPLLPSAGTILSASSIECPIPDHAAVTGGAVPQPATVYVEVSPNSGKDWSNSRTPYTYGTCPSCSLQGTCNVATGRCDCNSGFVTLESAAPAECSGTLSADTLVPSQGPTTGGLEVTITGTGYDASTACSAILIRLKDAASGFEATVRGRRVSDTVVTGVIPRVSAAMVVTVEVSPNSGRDWVSAPSFTYVQAATLYEGQILTGRIASNAASDMVFLESFFGDATVGLEIEASSPSGGAVALAVGRGTGAHTDASICASSQVTCGTTLSSPAGSTFVGLYSLALSTTDAGGADYSIRMGVAGGAGTVVSVTPNATRGQPGFSTSSTEYRQYSVVHTSGPFATVISVSPADSSAPILPVMSQAPPPVDSTSGSALVAGSLVVQGCESSATYSLGVAADGSALNGAGFTVTALQVPPPTVPSSVQVSSTFRSIRISWEGATDLRTAREELEYYVFYQGALTQGQFNSSCVARRGTLAAGPLSGQTSYSVSIGSLKPAFAYDLAIVVRNQDGVETNYAQVTKRTVPSDIPTATLIAIGVGAAACICLSCVALRCWKKRKAKKRARKAEKARAAAGAVATKTRKAKAKTDFKAKSSGELSFKKGEILVLMGKATKQGWIMARSSKGKQGLVPFTYFRIQPSKGSGGRRGTRV